MRGGAAKVREKSMSGKSQRGRKEGRAQRGGGHMASNQTPSSQFTERDGASP